MYDKDDVRALVAEKDLKETIRASRDYATLLVYYTENPSNQTEHPKTSAMKNADTLFAAELMRHSASLLTSQAETIAELQNNLADANGTIAYYSGWLAEVWAALDESGEWDAGVVQKAKDQAETIARLVRENGKLRELAAGAKEHLAILLSDYEEKTSELGNYRQDYGAPVYVEEDGIKQDMREFLKRLDAHLARKEGT